MNFILFALKLSLFSDKTMFEGQSQPESPQFITLLPYIFNVD